MNNQFDAMRAAVNEASDTLRAADSVAAQMASLLRGRLRKVSPFVLADLKRELRDYDIHRKEWKR